MTFLHSILQQKEHLSIAPVQLYPVSDVLWIPGYRCWIQSKKTRQMFLHKLSLHLQQTRKYSVILLQYVIYLLKEWYEFLSLLVQLIWLDCKKSTGTFQEMLRISVSATHPNLLIKDIHWWRHISTKWNLTCYLILFQRKRCSFPN